MDKIFQHFDERQEMANLKYEVFHYQDKSVPEVALHLHDHYEVLFLINGKIDYFIGGFTYEMRAGDLLMIPPGVSHRPLPNSGSSYERFVLWVDRRFLEELSTPESDLSSCFGAGTCLYHNSGRYAPRIAELLHSLNQEYYSTAFGHEFYSRGLFLQLLTELNRMAIYFGEKYADRKGKPIQLVVDVLSYIDTNYAEDLSLEKLAELFFVSKYHLSHVFSDAMGISPYRYIIEKRLYMAKQMLEEGCMPGEVCFRCGFKDYTNFYKAFKSEYNTSPKSFYGHS